MAIKPHRSTKKDSGEADQSATTTKQDKKKASPGKPKKKGTTK